MTLKWTRQPPKTPGYYWWRQGNDEPRIVLLDENEKVWLHGIEYEWPLDHYIAYRADVEWVGPIPKPSESKETP